MKRQTEEKLSILVSSCDKYEDAWPPFFKLLDANWKDCKYPIYLNTESKEYPDLVCGKKVLALHTPNGRIEPWSKRLKNALRRIPTEFVLFALEDFFFMSPIHSEVVENALAYMQKDPNIVNFCFYPMTSANNTESLEYPGFIKRSKEDPYLVQCQVGIWRKEVLIKLLRSYEDAWNFESDGTLRARKLPGDYYSARFGSPTCFPYYLSPKHGYGIYGGRWLWNDRPLFEKFGIEVDYSKRETIGSPEELQRFFEKRGSGEVLKAEEAAYQNSFRYKVKSHLPDFLVGWIQRIKKK